MTTHINPSTLTTEAEPETQAQIVSLQTPPKRGVSRRRLLWARFKANRLGMIGTLWIVILIFIAVFAEFLAPYGVEEVQRDFKKMPPQRVYFVKEGDWLPTAPFVYGYEKVVNRETFSTTFVEDRSVSYPLRLFVKGMPYKLLGVIPTDVHLFGAETGGTIFLFGTDSLGYDVFSRVLIASRVSLLVPLVGMLIAVTLGSIIGVASGYWGGLPDLFIQRFTEVLMSFPRIPLWLALAAALPADMPSFNRYLGVTALLSLIGWAGLCRQIRGKTLALKESEFIMAARVAGSSQRTILLGHLLPNCISHIIVVATLTIPGLILAESSLSFLGVGITPPLVSWGTLLKEAQNVHALLSIPWLLAPGAFILITVLAFNLFGDALRDALDPYSKIR
ncbi:MAG: ABC transporter permease [Anaerolineae bacterium]|nr:ABC transporter permease [Anaerolineae bacterium]